MFEHTIIYNIDENIVKMNHIGSCFKNILGKYLYKYSLLINKFVGLCDSDF